MATPFGNGSSCSSGCRYVDQAYSRCRELERRHQSKCAENQSLIFTNSSLRKENMLLKRKCAEYEAKASGYDDAMAQLDRERQVAEKYLDEIAEQKARIRKLESDERDSSIWRNEARDKIRLLKDELSSANEELASLREIREKLEEEKTSGLNEIARLKSILSNNPSNTSIPPSRGEIGKDSHSHRTKRANEYNDRDAEKKAEDDAIKRSKGGQKDRRGTTLTKEDVEEFLKNNSGRCIHEVYEIGTKAEGRPYRVKYTIGTETKVVIREYRYYSDAELPLAHYSDVTYDSSLKALAAYLYGECNMPTDKIKDLFHVISDGLISISEGSAYNFCREVSDKATISIGQLCIDLLNGKVLYTDATNTREDGRQTYVRNASNDRTVVYSPQDSKTIEEIGKTAVIESFIGTIMADHEVALKHFGSESAECIQHVGRYCRKNDEETGHGWSKDFMDLMYRIKDRKEELMKEEKNGFAEEDLNGYFDEYDEILKRGWQQHEEDVDLYDYASKDERALLRRFESYKEDHLRFATDFDVDFTNNRSESDLRFVKQRTKATGGFRNKSGRQICCDIMSVIRTCKKRNMPIFENLKAIAATGANIFA